MLKGVLVATSLLLGTTTAWGDSKPATTDAKPKAVRIKVSFASTELSLVIPPARPATLENEGWTHVLAIVGTERTDASVTLNIAAFPKSEDRASLTNDKVVKQAKVRLPLTPRTDVVLSPGGNLPTELFGGSPPKSITVKWVSK